MKKSVVLLMLFVSHMVTAKIYTWNDEKGNPIFSNVPPKNQEAELFNLKNSNQVDTISLELNHDNIKGMWNEYADDGSYMTLEFKEPNEIVILQYDNNTAYYKAEGTWSNEGDNVFIELTSTINQKSNFRSKGTVKQQWRLDSLSNRELALIIDGESVQFGR